jgi:diguanylate cyclase (GGDEF)-like protein
MSVTKSHSVVAPAVWHRVLDAVPAPTFLKNSRQELIAVSDSFCNLVNCSREHVLGFQDFEIRPGEFLFDALAEQRALENGTPCTFDRELFSENAARRKWLRIHLARSLDPTGAGCLVGWIEDLTALSNASLSLEVAERQSQMAFSFDALTGLLNRSQIEACIDDCINVSQRNGTTFAVLLINLNGFKAINSIAGHQAGDHLLRVCGNRIRQVVQGQTAVARFGSDEYVVLLTGSDPVNAGRIAERITEMINMPIQLEGARREVSSSVGVTMYPRDGKTYGELLSKADQAMHAGKRSKPSGNVQFFEPSIGSEVERKLILSRDLVEALDSDQIKLHFQPIVLHSDGQVRVVGYESLARWRRDENEWVSPEEFVPLLEQNGLIVEAGEKILRQACEFIASHTSDDVYVSVNVSGQQVLDDGFIDMIDRVTRATGVAPRRLALELTETLAMSDRSGESEILQRLIDRGIRLMIDDFGTGYSNLARLRELPFSMLKIDRSLIRDVPDDQSDCAILKTLISMARELEMGLVVEGIEDAAQRDYLIELGVDTFQGYLFGKPKPY